MLMANRTSTGLWLTSLTVFVPFWPARSAPKFTVLWDGLATSTFKGRERREGLCVCCIILQYSVCVRSSDRPSSPPPVP